MTLTNYKQRKKESRAFKKITDKRNLQVRRQAFAEESLIQARKEGKRLAVAKAQKGNFGEQVRRVGSYAGKTIARKVLAPPTKAVVKKTSVKRKPSKRITVKRKPIKKRNRTIKTTQRRVEVERTPTSLPTPAGFEGF